MKRGLLSGSLAVLFTLSNSGIVAATGASDDAYGSANHWSTATEGGTPPPCRLLPQE